MLFLFFCVVTHNSSCYNEANGGEKLKIGERIKYVRESLNLSQSKFGETMGVSRDVISNVELGRVEPKEYILRLICKTYRANYLYLTEEFGDPFVGVPEIIMDDVIEEYRLDATDRALIEEYVKLDEETRQSFKQYLFRVLEKAQKESAIV